MKVTVEIITGTFIDTQVNEDATVKELKEKIAAEVKLPVKRLILVIGDEETRRVVMDNEDEMMLRELGVRECSHMYLFFKHPDLASKEERSRGEEEDDVIEISSETESGRGDEEEDDDSMEEISSEAESERGDEEEEDDEKTKIDGEEEDEAMKDDEEGRDEKVKQDEEGKNNGEEGEDDDDDDVKEVAREGEDSVS